MRSLLKDLALLGTAFGLGYIYAEVKAGREFEWESPKGIIKIHIPSDLSEEIETEIEDLKN